MGERMALEWSDLAFHREIGAVIEALDGPQFWTRLTRTLERHVAFESWVALRFEPRAAPAVCAESPTPDGAVDLMFRDYLAALYQLDPFYIDACERPVSGFVTLADVAPDNFTMTDYYQRYFQKNIVGDEVHFNCRIDSRQTFAFSLGSTRRFSDRDYAVLAVCAPWIIALMRQRWPHETFDTALAESASAVTHNDAARFERIAQTGGRAALTSREVEITMLTLSGFSTRAIAEKLDISFETVRAHKKHVYAKLNVKSQSELFSLFYEAV
ncbi:LuxR family transcriptional regulator [Paraburkholderia caballeronis]|uniref:Regulatory protein, luxR family n=2 Tax=Paraburkholderia caballeronis TaxID=416943 RepID=A0A1H7RQA8_9BURK|nr:LuxR family transcriptional regulator [Paraburkholderia caballeronis]PXW97783.1 LuxR family transcriptional regulator [Paraburkholderia caballeronis]RAJ94753.1 LuxR family transcriptional regulator [Paraburkholderia caballeronis]TDV11719.1 LuxR family transcriptional regulator [Paraburkholderia caballeronis]TDV14800.1 LuxR family transcriptional regulator [Paraburkholderia caballeronis]